MRRRDLLRTSAAAVGGGAAGLALTQLAGDARAETALTLDVIGDSATLDADESVTAVWLDLTADWAYDLPDSATPDTVVVEIAAAEGDAEPEVVADAESAQLFSDADGSESFSVDLVASDVLTDVTPDDGTRDTAVTIEARLRVLGGGDVLARDTVSDTATVSVERDTADASEYGDVGGSGTLTIETG